MLEGVRVILTHNIVGSLTLTSAPEGLFDLQYILTRSEKFHGMALQVSGNLGFTRDGKDYIDNIITTYGKTAKITFQYLVRNPETLIYEELFSGLLNVIKASKELNHTYCAFENTDFKTKLNSRSEITVPYNRLKSIEDVTIQNTSYQYVNLLCQGVSDNIVTHAIYPFELFYSVIKQITDIDYNVLLSTLLGRTTLTRADNILLNYTSNGELAFRLVTKGTYLRGWDETTSELSLSLEDIFDSIDKQKPIGLGFSLDQYNREIVIIEEREYFFQSVASITLDDNRITDLKKELSEEFLFNEIEIGNKKSVKKENPLGMSEYNNKVTYAVPVTFGKNKLSLINDFRTDGVAVNDIITNFQKVGDDTKESEYDEEKFIIDSIESSGTFEGTPYTFKNRRREGFVSVSGIYEDPNLWYNLELAPARLLQKRYGSFINIGLYDIAGLLKFNQSENLSKLITLATTDSEPISECTDIDISLLSTSVRTGYMFRFNYPFTVNEIKTIKDNFYGQVLFRNHVENKDSGGWIKEISTKIADKTTNVELYECSTLAEALGFMLHEDNSFMLHEDGSLMLME